jgi:predicted RND superfamily exporter protein
MADFGLLTGVAMLAALAGDLFLLPCLLQVFDKDRQTEGN